MSRNSAAVERLRALLAKSREAKAQKAMEELAERQAAINTDTLHTPQGPDKSKVFLHSGDKTETEVIEYNDQQLRAINLGAAGKSLVLTGAAGSGKTTTVKGMIAKMVQTGAISTLPDRAATEPHKWIHAGMPSIACVGFTNKSVQNLKKALPADLRQNCITIHKLLEFQPEYVTEFDAETGEDKTTMQFLPNRHKLNPLPFLDVLIIDESTMVSVDLWNLLADAIGHEVQVILIGDIHQLPPVFGKSIFIWAMQAGAEVVELTHIYRQALDSPIISLAHRIKSGKQLPQKDWDEYSLDKPQGKVTLRPWKKKLSETAAIKTIQMFLPQLIDSGAYDPFTDVILTPFNKSFGTIIMNLAIATHLAKLETEPRKKEVWEIYAGINKKYLRIGDKVLHNKSEVIVTDIKPNRVYYGKQPRKPSDTMDYAGMEHDTVKRMENRPTQSAGMESIESIDSMLEAFTSHTDGEDRISRQASHVVTVYNEDLEQSFEIDSSGEMNQLDLGYAITVHKSQGSEYPRVLLITHGSQANMFFRELLYTAVTRASRELYVICEPSFFVKGITTQRVPGDTLEQKIESFDRTMKLGKRGTDEKPKRLDLIVGAPDYAEVTEAETYSN